MMLDAGVRFGSYEIVAALGAGGMGEVYRARDTTLNREVAIKILPDAFALDPERLARFEREAQLLAVMNHPHIAQIHALERYVAGGSTPSFIVMELVEGVTLDERIARGPLAVADAVAIARQIADALEAAHEAGIIHRDLKPSNIKVREDGTVKVLDFGLAKLSVSIAGQDDGPVALSRSPTITTPPVMTGASVILGTAAYMAPEQAKGRAVDKRADIWAFGCVLYEMLTARRAFPGDDVSDTLASILKTDPDLTRLPPTTPIAIAELLRRCLVKDARQRLRDIGDARLEIDAVISGRTGNANESIRRVTWRQLFPWTVVAALVVALATIGIVGPRSGARPAELIRTTVALAPGDHVVVDGPYGSGMIAFSPDGSALVYPAYHDDTAQLFIRRLDSNDPRAIPGSEDGSEPFFSPDGQWLGFFARGRLWKVSVAGGSFGQPIDICAVLQPLGGTWAAGNTIVFADGWVGDALFRVASDGGTPKPSIRGEPGTSPVWPHALAQGDTILFGELSALGRGLRVVAARLDDGSVHQIVERAGWAQYASSGHLLFAREFSLFVAPFDPVTLKVTGEPQRVSEPVAVATGPGPLAALSNEGHLLTVPPRSIDSTLVWVNRDGTTTRLPASPQPYTDMALSPDGRKLAIGLMGLQEQDVWLYELDRERSPLTRITRDDKRLHWTPAWSNGSERLVFFSGTDRIFLSRTRPGSDAVEPIWSANNVNAMNPTVSPDGRWCVFTKSSPGKRLDIWTVPLDGDRQARPLLDSEFSETTPQISPDGQWLAYASSETGRYEIYVRDFPHMSRKVQVSIEGGERPQWAAASPELFFQNGDRMMVAAYRSDGAFSPSTPTLLFTQHFVWGEFQNYAVSPDGKRLLMMKSVEPGPTHLDLAINWAKTLQ